MTGASLGMVLIALVLSMLAALLIVAGYNRLRRTAQPLPEKPSQGSAGAHHMAGVPGERMASAPAEMLQSIVIGAVIGGGKGAAIGAAIGGGAGAAVVLTTAGQEIRLPRGTVLSLPLDRAVDVRVPINKS